MATRKIVLTIVSLYLVAFEVSLLAVLVFFPYLPDPGLSSLNTDVYSLLAPLSTVFLVGLLYSWLISIGTREACRHSARFERFAQFLAEPLQQLRSFLRARSLSDSARTPNILS